MRAFYERLIRTVLESWRYREITLILNGCLVNRDKRQILRVSLSHDLRHRVLAAVDREMPRAEIVTTFQVSSGTLKRWLAKRRTTGTIVPTSPPGRTARIPAAQYPALVAQLAKHPDATLAQHIALWEARSGLRVSRWTMSRAIRAAGWTRKKSR